MCGDCEPEGQRAKPNASFDKVLIFFAAAVGRPIYTVEDENLGPSALTQKWETLCQIQGAWSCHCVCTLLLLL